MIIKETPLNGLMVIEPTVYGDDRGYFLESYNEKKFIDIGIPNKFVQDNESCSAYGVIRGLHYQLAPYAQAKLVRVVRGTVFDVAVDIRIDSPTFGKWYGVELSGENKRQFYIPRGFAHGFSVLSPEAVFIYKCDNFYNPNAEKGIAFDDPFLAIDWKLQKNDILVSEKDNNYPLFNDAEMNFK